MGGGVGGVGWPRYTGEGEYLSDLLFRGGGFLNCADLGSLRNTLVNSFKNNTATATFEDPRVYDESCKALGA